MNQYRNFYIEFLYLISDKFELAWSIGSFIIDPGDRSKGLHPFPPKVLIFVKKKKSFRQQEFMFLFALILLILRLIEIPTKALVVTVDKSFYKYTNTHTKVYQ